MSATAAEEPLPVRQAYRRRNRGSGGPRGGARRDAALAAIEALPATDAGVPVATQVTAAQLAQHWPRYVNEAARPARYRAAALCQAFARQQSQDIMLEVL